MINTQTRYKLLSSTVLMAVTATASMTYSRVLAQTAEVAAKPAGVAASLTQTAVIAASGGDAAMDQVVVTARRREESLSKVPVAVTALSAGQLAQRQIGTDQDLQRSVPGLTIRQNFNANFIDYSLRGQTVEAFSGSRPAVVAYFNDVQTPQGASSGFYDLSSIQVLKGPQGTLFGRNATGGAVLYTSTAPRNAYDGYLTASAGNYSQQSFEGALDLPIVSDKLLVRIAGLEKDRGGYVDNLFSGEKLGALRQGSGRITVLARPTSKLEISTTYQYSTNRGTDAGGELYSVYPCGGPKFNGYVLNSNLACLYSPALDTTIGVPGAWNAFLAAHPGLPAGGVLQELALQRSWGPWKTSLDEPEGFTGLQRELTNTMRYEFSPDLSFKNIVGIGDQRTHMHSDLDGTPYPVLHNYNDTTGESGVIFESTNFSEEAQVLGTAFNGAFKYIGGLFYSEEWDNNRQNLETVNLTPILKPSPDTYSYRPYNSSEAVFFQGTYDIGNLINVQNLRFTAGARWTKDNNEIKQTYGSVLYPLVGENLEKESDSKPSWQFGLEYQVLPDLLLYANQRGSWRGGGFNGAAPPVNAPASQGGNLFIPETTEDFEIGAKFNGQFRNLPAHASVAIYDQVINNVQRSAILLAASGIISVTASVPKAEVTGAELDGDFFLFDWLQLGGSFAWTDARYESGTFTVLNTPLDFNSYPDSPRLTGDLFALITLPIPPAWGTATLRGDVYSQTNMFFGSQAFSTEPGTSLPGYHLINLHADWNKVFGSRYSLSAFATNVGNAPYYVGGSDNGDALGENNATPGMPRMYGISASVRF